MTAERVAAAAAKVRGLVFTGQSHRIAMLVAANALGVDPAVVWKSVTAERQGFVTTRGRWLSRAGAWTLAKEQGQLRWDRSRAGQAPELFSEDLR